MSPKGNRRFSLLLYKRYHQTRSGLSKFLIVLGVLGLTSVIPINMFLGSEADPANVQALLLAALAVLILGVARHMFTIFVSKMAYAECRAKSLKVQTPFIPLVISYRRIRDTRPTVLREIFPPDEQKRNRNLLETYWGETVIVIEINKFPLPPGLLRFVMGPYHFTPNGNGLALLVDDWMAFSQSLDQALTEYRAQRTTPAGIYPSRR